MTINLNELATTVFSNGDVYPGCVALAKSLNANNPISVRATAHGWFLMSLAAARRYEKQFGSPGASCFTVADLLECASQLAAYYATHITETED